MNSESDYRLSDFLLASIPLWIIMFLVAWLSKTNGLGVL
jgi:hypothetical protein